MAKKKGNILIIDDSKSVLAALEILLKSEYSEVASLSNPNGLSSYPDFKALDVVLLDMNFSSGINSGNEGLYWLREIKKRNAETAVILMTAHGEIDLAVSGLKEGASDFMLKPWNNEKMLASIRSAITIKNSKKKIQDLEEKESGLKRIINEVPHEIIGSSLAITNLLKLTRKVAQTDANVLITGENGTGKELIAREIHERSTREREVFVKVDMGAIAETLFESELFGHVKGAFTDAKEDRVGKFEAAKGGTLFLDEIGNLSLALQAKLLSVIQNRQIVRVGSNKVIPVDIRLVCATNSDLGGMVKDGTFREDLLYRLNTIQVEVPALRDRNGDILLLAESCLARFAAKYDKTAMTLAPEAKEKLSAYHWPGNVRELQHAIERAVILGEDSVLQKDDLLLQSSDTFLEGQLPTSLDEMEKVMIQKALDTHGGNHTAAADQLGISRQTLYNKIKKMNLDV